MHEAPMIKAQDSPQDCQTSGFVHLATLHVARMIKAQDSPQDCPVSLIIQTDR